MKRIFIFLTVIFLCGSTSGQLRSQLQERTENWLQSAAQSEENNGVQGGNRAGDETPTGEVGVGTPIGSGIGWILLQASAYMFFIRRGKKEKMIINHTY
jgi:hypothetical protein